MNIWICSNRILETWTGHKWHFIISCLDPQKASGPDDINHRMVIVTENTICRPLCKLFNLSLRKKCFPSFWKLANVTAVFKKSVKSITSNYRTISLLSCVSRIFERTVFKYVFYHISGHKYIHKLQWLSHWIFHFTSTSWNIPLYYDCIWKSDSFDIDILWCK